MKEPESIRVAIRRHKCEYTYHTDGSRECETAYAAHIMRTGQERTVCGLDVNNAAPIDQQLWQFQAWADPRYAHDESGASLAKNGGRSLSGSWHVAAHTGCCNCWLSYHPVSERREGNIP